MASFASLLSDLKTATGVATGGNINGGTGRNASNSGAPTPPSEVDPTSKVDPSFQPSIVKECIERMLRVQQMRRSFAASTASAAGGGCPGAASDGRTNAHIAVCATIVDDFPHEAIWRRWLASGGELDGLDGRVGGFTSSAELYVHAKNPERVRSAWLRSKTLPVTHRPDWNDVRIVRAILSLIAEALKDARTTHILLCTESCVPITTLKEAARSVLVDEVCPWEEEEGKSSEGQGGKSVDWDRSYVDCYGRDSSRCSRFDEHSCWGALRDCIPADAIYKALPGWCLLSRKHARSMLDLPDSLGGNNLWPAFERVWAPEEVYLPTALSVCGHMDEVSRRALTHSRWDERAARHEDRAHPLSYDGRFGHELVSSLRRDGRLFLRKVKRPLDLDVWERVVLRKEEAEAPGDSAVDRDWEGRRGGHRDERPHQRDRYGSDRRHDSSYDSRRRHDPRGNRSRDGGYRKRDRYDNRHDDDGNDSWKRHRR